METVWMVVRCLRTKGGAASRGASLQRQLSLCHSLYQPHCPCCPSPCCLLFMVPARWRRLMSMLWVQARDGALGCISPSRADPCPQAWDEQLKCILGVPGGQSLTTWFLDVSGC